VHPMFSEALAAARRTELEHRAVTSRHRRTARTRADGRRRPARVAVGMGLVGVGLRLIDSAGGDRGRTGRLNPRIG